MASDIRGIGGGVTAARGFRAAGMSAGIKKTGAPDLALVWSDRPATAVGVFTTSLVKAHPVVDGQAKLAAGARISGVLVNSGSANACTGPEGMADLKAILGELARRTGVPVRSLLMSSTGVIGERLPAGKITSALPELTRLLSAEGGGAAARAIMTTDTRPKECAVEVATAAGPVRIGGMAKGAGMINPKMATMLAFLTTDAAFTGTHRGALGKALRQAVDLSFNRVDLDTDTSTNDTVVLLAGGASGVDPFDAKAGRGARAAFLGGLEAVCLALARMIAADTEGATKLLVVRVAGAASARQAELAARAVAESPLVKTAVHGEDPNWGRIMAALGRSGARFDPGRVDISVNGLQLVKGGRKKPGVTEEEARAALKPAEVELAIELHAGKGSCDILSGDLTADYVRINASYRS